MAERRMFAKTIIDSDAFLDMPLSTQALYFHLSMRADDDGFVNNPKRIMRTIGANQNDYDVLIAKKFVLTFDTGVIVIKHWKLHNYIRKDRYKPTVYQQEKEMLHTKKNGSYTLGQPNDNHLSTSGGPRLGKDRLGKDRLGKDNKEVVDKPKKKEPIVYDPDELLNQTILDFIDFRKKIKSPMTDRAITLMLNKLNKLSNNNDEKIEILNQSIINGWKGIFPLSNNNKKYGKQTFDDFVEVGKEWLNDTAGVFDDSSND